MGHRLSVRVLAGGLGVWALVASAGLAAGQDSKKSDDRQPGTVLGGPAVNDAGLPGQKRSFSADGKTGKDRLDGRGIPPRIFMQAFGVLRGDQVAESVRLTAGQDEMIRAVREDFEANAKAYREAHRNEVVDLRSKLSPESQARFDERMRAAGLGGGGDGDRKAGKGKGKGERPGAKGKGNDRPADEMEAPAKGGADDAAGANDERIKRRLVEIMEGAPKPKDAQAKVMSALSEPQKTLVKTEIERLRKEGDKKVSAGAPAGAAGDLSGLPENARERLKNMTPEQREQAMKRIQERRAQRQGGEPKPAPSADDVNVPKPEGEAAAPAPKRRKN